MDPRGAFPNSHSFQEKRPSALIHPKVRWTFHHCWTHSPLTLPELWLSSTHFPNTPGHQTGLWAMPTLRSTKPTVNTVHKNEMSLQNQSFGFSSWAVAAGAWGYSLRSYLKHLLSSIEGLMGKTILNRHWPTDDPLSTVHKQLNPRIRITQLPSKHMISVKKERHRAKC